jgi:uncharacterized membrane protein
MSDWYYALGNEQKGPVSETELRVNLATQKLPAETLVWTDGMDNWQQASQVAKLAVPAASAATVPGSNPSSIVPTKMSDLLGKPEALEVDYDDSEKNKVFGIIAYLPMLCLVPIFAVKDSPFAKYHANQGLVLFILCMVIVVTVNIVSLILATLLPSFGIFSVIFSLLYVGLAVLMVMGIINASQGKCVPLPLIGGVKLLK